MRLRPAVRMSETHGAVNCVFHNGNSHLRHFASKIDKKKQAVRGRIENAVSAFDYDSRGGCPFRE
jgi:hypothetical protein